jgi:chromosome partitioning protein
MGKIVAIVNQKGGVGKTTTAVNLSSCVAALEYKTLLVDFDPQGNSSSGVGLDKSRPQHVYHGLLGLAEPAELIVETQVPFLYLLPSGQDLAGAEIELVSLMARETRLKKMLEKVREDYDFIFVDCPPSLGLLTVNALVAADSILVPVQTEYFALEGLSDLMGTIGLIRSELNPQLVIEGLLLTMVDERTRLARDVANEVKVHFGAQVFDTVIPRNIKLSESPSHGEPIIMYDIASKGAQAYLALAAEFVDRQKEGAA